MNNDMHSDHDQSRQDAFEEESIRDTEDVVWQDSTTYSMSLPQVYARFVEADLDRSLRTLQRYCEQGHLRAAKYPTETGAVWYVDPESVETKIKEIRQVQEATLHRSAAPRPDTPPSSHHDVSRPDAEHRSPSSREIKDDESDTSRSLK